MLHSHYSHSAVYIYAYVRIFQVCASFSLFQYLVCLIGLPMMNDYDTFDYRVAYIRGEHLFVTIKINAIFIVMNDLIMKQVQLPPQPLLITFTKANFSSMN